MISEFLCIATVWAALGTVLAMITGLSICWTFPAVVVVLVLYEVIEQRN